MNQKTLSPYMIIILGFLGFISIGTFLLLLPFATIPDYQLSFVDALYTSTSAVCVTGLVSVPSISEVYTTFGKVVIIVLIEIGGLGFVTVTTFAFAMLGLKIGIKDRFLLKEALNQNSLRGLVRLVLFTITITLSFQLFGAIINFIVFSKEYPLGQAIGVSIFHAISAFNNAGFDIFGTNSMQEYSTNLLLNLNTSFLIITGGIGFIVIYDIVKKRRWKDLSIHTKIVLKTTFVLLVVGTLLIKFTQHQDISWLQAFFTSVAARTAGFATVNFNSFSNAGLVIICVLMYFGASPSSTGGGIKTTTLYTMFKFSTSFAKGKTPTTHQRKIPNTSIEKAFVLIVLSLSFISFVIFLVAVVEQFNPLIATTQYDYFTKIVFETFSAFGTVGNSMGITENLLPMSKFIYIVTMFFGRLGPITIVSVLNKNWTTQQSKEIQYVEERIIIG